MKPLACALLALAAVAASAHQALGQTFEATWAIHEVKCQRFLFSNKCVTVETDRLHSTFTREKLGFYVFGRTWATASHCTRLDATETKCLRSISISTDPEWNRVLWGQAGTFLRLLGTGGTSAEGPFHFLQPLGVDITRREGEWHVGFIADAGNDRIAVIGVGYTCKCVRWLGTLDGSESGTPLNNPHDVAWDPADTWTFADDRVFIADTDNNRIVVYRVDLNPAAGTMTKTYQSSFGSQGQGPSQFSRPQGVTVTSWVHNFVLNAHVHVADTDNGRVSLWKYGWGGGGPLAQSIPIANAQPTGITRDFYGDVIVADRARDVLVKFTSGLAFLKTYGGTSSWSTGNFNDPTDAAVIPHYWQDASGQLIQERLPFVQTVEAWTATTGGQLHHLGVDAEQLGASAGVCDATFTFLFTAYGDYTVKVKNSGGAVVQSWTRTGVSSGLKSEYWNGKDRPPGTYSYVVEHRNAYGDETEWRTSVGPSFTQSCFTVTADAPSQALQGGTYALNGLSTHPADSWKWERSDGSGYYLWANAQNSSFHVPFDPGRSYTILWRLTARRSADGMWDSDGASTTVLDDCNRDPCPFSPTPSIATSDRTTQSGVGQRVVQPQTGPERHNSHIGSGAWIGGRTASGPMVFRLYGFTGAHAVSTPAWPNALAGEVETVQEAANQGARSPPRAVFSRKPVSAEQDAYRVRFALDSRRLSEAFVGLALDPELGVRASDDSLGLDAQSGLIWVADPDSGVIGYLVTDMPPGTRAVVRQFSTRKDGWRPDPASDSAAYAEISAGDDALTEKPGDARFLIAVGPVAGDAKLVDVGFVMLTAPSLAVLRERAANAPRSVLQFFADDTARVAGRTAITRFHLTQAPPDPTAPDGVRAISPDLVPRLSPGTESTPLAGSERAALRDAVRRYGITALAFAVPDGSQAHVKIRLYDPAGRLVRTLVDETYDTGAYRMQWDLKDQRGSRAAPGVYIAVMETKGFRAMTRLVVVP